jgi:hypothetical protein
MDGAADTLLPELMLAGKATLSLLVTEAVLLKLPLEGADSIVRG